MWRTLIALFVVISLNSMASAQEPKKSSPPPTREEIERMEAIDNLTDLVESLDQQTKPLLRKRGNQCLKAFGHQKFCSCVNVHIPIGMPFEQYIKVTISTKDELGYAGLSEQQKEIVDTVLKVREQCVKTVWGQ